MCPAGLLRNPEDVGRAVFVGVFRVGPFALFGGKLRVNLGEGVGNVLEEDEPEYDMLVLGRVQVVAELVRRQPERLLEAQIGPVARVACTGFRLSSFLLAILTAPLSPRLYGRGSGHSPTVPLQDWSRPDSTAAPATPQVGGLSSHGTTPPVAFHGHKART